MKFKPAHKSGGVVVELGSAESNAPVLSSDPNSTSSAQFHLQRILVPVDFSECARKALAYAIAFARRFNSELTLLHVVAPYPPVPQMDPVDLEFVQDAKEQLKSLRSTLGDDVPSKILVRTGEPYAEIILTAKELGVDLIILATHGRTGLAHVLVGSTTEKVVRHGQCPILIVRDKEHDFVEAPPR